MGSRRIALTVGVLAASAGTGWMTWAGKAHAAATPVKYVDMVNTSGKNPFAYKPQTITIRAGTNVVWRNRSAAPHTVTGTKTKFSGIKSNIGLKEKTSYVFRKAGTFPYYCVYHPFMKGKVIVKH